MEDHGFEQGFYTNGPYGTNPVIRCECGFETSPANECWGEAGEEYDDHLVMAGALDTDE